MRSLLTKKAMPQSGDGATDIDNEQLKVSELTRQFLAEAQRMSASARESIRRLKQVQQKTDEQRRTLGMPTKVKGTS